MTEALRAAAAGWLDVGASGGGYPVAVGPGLLEHLPGFVAAFAPTRRLALVSDDQVAPLHGAAAASGLREAGHDVVELTFPAGEASKTRKTWSILTDRMLDAGLGRDSLVVAVGGGVTTDLAGFVAATYLRGVPVVQVPTSSLAMVDASVGGKTGVDVRAGKNLVGAFLAPRAVVADTATLATLDRRHLAEGLVEAVKHGAILDPDHLHAIERALDALLRADGPALAGVVAASVAIKARVVSGDEFETGVREVLNFGHTIGHAIEAASEYRVGHGRAIAYGMVAEARLGEAMGVTASGTAERLAGLLGRLVERGPLPMDPEAVTGFLASDKKARGGRVRFVLLERAGRVAEADGFSRPAPPGLVEDALGSVLGGW